MAVISKGTTFATGDQVTAGGLNNLVDNSTFTSGAVDNTSTQLSGGGIIVKDGGITSGKLANDAVTFGKIQQVDANTVLVRDAGTAGSVSSKAVTDTQLLIGNGTGFTAAAMSGDVTMTNAGVTNIEDSVALGGNPTTTTQSVGDNSTRIATTAYADAAGAIAGSKAVFTKSNQGFGNTGLVTSYSESDPDGIASESSGTITVTGSGIFIVSFFSEFSLDSSEDWTLNMRIGESSTSTVFTNFKEFSGSGRTVVSGTTFFTSTGSFKLDIQAFENQTGGTCDIYNARIEILKLT
jgi:hypothetical protein